MFDIVMSLVIYSLRLVLIHDYHDYLLGTGLNDFLVDRAG